MRELAGQLTLRSSRLGSERVVLGCLQTTKIGEPSVNAAIQGGMKAYRHRGDDSGIVAYEYGPNWIRLRFAGGNVYVYPARQIGLANLRQMKRLAKAGRGLATFVNQHPEVKNGYTR